MMIRFLLCAALLCLGLPRSVSAQAACGRVLVSGYNSNVHVYDACTGAFERLLDSNGRISGAQATRIRNGLIYVVSEETQSILRYRADTLEFVDSFISTGTINPTGIDFGPDGDVYVGGYESDSVVRFDGVTGVLKSVVVAPGSAGLNGADNGLVFGPDGLLYIPGYDSDNVLRYNPANGQTTVWVAPGTGGLRHSRGILFEPGGQTALVASEGSNALLRFRTNDGSLVANVVRLISRPTGLAYNADGELLVTGDRSNAVLVLDPQTGAQRRVLVSSGSGGLDTATFVTYLAGRTSTAVTLNDTVGSQYWIAGLAQVTGRVMDAAEAFTSTGTAFGSGFDPATVRTPRWGRIRIEWTDCDAANLTWDSTGSNSAGFGAGGYALQRLASNVAGADCRSRGFAATTGNAYMSGAWSGGPSRSGEGLVLDALADGQVIVSFFTHRPRTN